MKKELIESFEEMIREMEEELPADYSWGTNDIWGTGSLNLIARKVTLYQFMSWLKAHGE